jgi:putative sterol carrier protein
VEFKSMMAVMGGRSKIKGDMGLAVKLSTFLGLLRKTSFRAPSST